MKTKILMASALSSFLALAPAGHASVITDDTRYDLLSAPPGDGSSAAYISNWDRLAGSAPTPGYGDYTLTSMAGIQNPGGTTTNIASHIEITFDADVAGTWSFRIAVDAGWGGTMLVDGTALDTVTTDMWWNGSWVDGPSPEYLSESVTLAAGDHTIDLYTVEPCCDGPGDGQFAGPASNSVFTSFSSTDGADPIPEPVSLALFAPGLFGIGMIRRRRA